MLTPIRCLFHPTLLQWHLKDPSHSAKSAGGSLHLNTHTAMTQQSRSGLTMPLFRHSVGTYQGNERTCNLSGNIQPQLSQLTEPLWSDPCIKSGISVRELISTHSKINKLKSAGREWMVEHSLKILASEEKATKYLVPVFFFPPPPPFFFLSTATAWCEVHFAQCSYAVVIL